MKASEQANILWPYLLKKIERVVSASAGSSSAGTPGIGGAPSPHALQSAHHTGTISDAQGPQFLLLDGTRDLTGNLSVDALVTIDGVDISVHAADPNAHHDTATAGDGIDLTGQQINVDVTDIIDTSYGLYEPTTNNIGIKLLSGMTALAVDSNGLAIANAIAGDGLAINGTTKVLSVNVSNGLEINSDNVRVNQAYNFSWTGNHTFSTGAVQFNTDPQVNANLDFIGGDRSITASNNLTIAPTTDLILDPTGLIVLPNAQELRTGTFSDLPTGIVGLRLWDRGSNYRQLTMGAGKFDELYVRVFVADEVRIDRGEEYWSKSYGVVETDFTLPADEANVDVWFENSPAMAAANLFSVGDWLLARTIDWDTSLTIEKIWFTVVSLQTAGSVDGYRQQWRIKREDGGTTGSIVKKGNVFLDSGQVGQGWIHLSALEQDGGPFIQIGEYTSLVGDSPQFTNYVRFGNLNGTVDYAVDTWGMAAGSDGTDGIASTPSTGFSGFTIDGDDGLRLFNTDLELYDGSDLILSIDNTYGISMLADTSYLGNQFSALMWMPVLPHQAPGSGADSIPFGVITTYHDSAFNWMQLTADGNQTYYPGIFGAISLAGNGVTGSALTVRGGSGTGPTPYGWVELATKASATKLLLMGDNADFTASRLTATGRIGAGLTSTTPASTLHSYDDNSSTGATVGVTIEQDGTGDARLNWLLTGGVTYSMGIDNSDSDKFKLSRSATLGTTSVLVFDSSDNATLTGVLAAAGADATVSNATVYSAANANHTSIFNAENTSGTNGASAGIAFRVDGTTTTLQRAWFGATSNSGAVSGPDLTMKIRTGASTYMEPFRIEGDTGITTLLGLVSPSLAATVTDATVYVATDATHTALINLENTSSTTGSSAGIAFRANTGGGSIPRAFLGIISNSSGNPPDFALKVRTASGYAEAWRVDENIDTIFGGKIGAGGITGTPGAQVDVTTSSTTPGFRAIQYNAAAPTLAGWRAQGTSGSPTQVGNGNILALFSGRGYTSGGWASDNSGEIQIVAAESFNGGTTGQRGTRIEFYTTDTAANSMTRRLTIGTNGQITLSGAAYSSYTSASAANVYMDSSGLIWRSTSSARYKTDIRALPDSLGDDFIDKLQPIVYKSTNPSDGERDFVGLVAEDVLAAGGAEYLYVDEDGTPQGIMYERLIVALVQAVQQAKRDIRTLIAGG